MQELKAILPSFATAPGFDAEKFVSAHELPAVNSFRINRKKIQLSPFPDTYEVPWCDDGFYAKVRPAYAQHPYWHGGAFYVQEASSMFLHYIIKELLPLNQKLFVLDACAAPGGKSTLIASLLNEESVVVSNEVINSRVPVLQENIIKWGNANAIITNSDSQQFAKLNQVFDCIVVDAPCSGSGLFRKGPKALNEWSESNVSLCCDRQQRIVGNLVPALKDEGLLIYSTCSFSTEENEAMVEVLCNSHHLEPVELIVPEAWNIVVSQKGCHRFYPYNVEGEGFFISVMRKKETKENKTTSASKTLKRIKPNELFEPFFKPGYSYFNHNETLFAASENLLELTEILKSARINLIRCGVEGGQLKGNKFIPAHALALNEVLNAGIAFVNLDENTALNYLRKQTITLEAPKGYTLVRYNNLNLGWINMLADRCNNLYPTNWRLMH